MNGWPWGKHPLIFFLPFYLSGLLVGKIWPQGKFYFLFLTLICLTGAIIFYRRPFFPFTLGAFLAAAGALWQSCFFLPPHSSRHITAYWDKHVCLRGRISSISAGDERSRLILDHLCLLKDKKKLQIIKGKILVTIHRPHHVYRLGHVIEINGKLKPLRNFGNPGSFDYASFWQGKGVWARMFVEGRNVIIYGYQRPNLWSYLLESYRERLRTFLEQTLPQPSLGIYQALLLGEKDKIPSYIKDDFSFTGTSHLLAISGLHLGMVMTIFYVLFWFTISRFECILLSLEGKKLAAFLAFIPTFLYASLAHFSPATSRSFLMLVFFWWLYFSRRFKNTWVFLATAAWILLLFHPPMLFQLSFQLSFLALASIFYLTPRLPYGKCLLSLKPDSLWKKVLRYISLSFYGTLAAWLGTLPVVLHYFAGISLGAPFLNLLAIPLVGFVILPAGLISIFILPLSVSLAQSFILLGDKVLNVVLLYLHKLAALSGIFVWSFIPNWSEVLVLYILFLSLWHFKHRLTRYILAGSLCFFLLDFGYNACQQHAKTLRISFLDVGHSTSVFLQFPQGKTMLLGGGGFRHSAYDPGRFIVARALWAQKIMDINYLVLPTPHYSYLKGLVFISSHFNPQVLWTNGLVAYDPDYWNLYYTCKEQGVPIFTPKILPRIQKINGVTVKLLYPLPNQKISSYKDSLVLQFIYKHMSFLFPFYLSRRAAHALIKFPLKSDVLLAPNYGSKEANFPAFVQAVSPRYVVFPTGRPPSASVMAGYLRKGISVLFTAKAGMITFVTDGTYLKVKTYHPQTRTVSALPAAKIVYHEKQ
ncbi:MAG: ComEC/Rec2 family competence protein [Candidatus Desulfofervidaceae bacterium]|nr:ComEC/Rec2 family competence protein [Candidatus Desulfofervidaceae bacterium]